MANSNAIERLRNIESSIRVISGLENVNPLLVSLLDKVAIDAQWLCDNLWQAWATVEAYQQEIRDMYK